MADYDHQAQWNAEIAIRLAKRNACVKCRSRREGFYNPPITILFNTPEYICDNCIHFMELAK